MSQPSGRGLLSRGQIDRFPVRSTGQSPKVELVPVLVTCTHLFKRNTNRRAKSGFLQSYPIGLCQSWAVNSSHLHLHRLEKLDDFFVSKILVRLSEKPILALKM